MREAWEEAGVKDGISDKEPIGTYTYQKRRNNGLTIPVETLVYSVAVTEMSEAYPEADERQQRWVDAETAAELVYETDLKTLILNQKQQAKKIGC